MTRISRDLHIVVELDPESQALEAHITPISTEVWMAYHAEIGATFSHIYNSGLGDISGPLNATLVLRDIAVERGKWAGPKGVEMLMAEIRRLTNVITVNERGREAVPFDDAVKMGLIDRREALEVEGTAVFFTAAWHQMPRRIVREKLDFPLKLRNARLESLSCSEYLASFKPSTPAENSGATAAASSGTSSTGQPAMDLATFLATPTPTGPTAQAPTTATGR